VAPRRQRDQALKNIFVEPIYEKRFGGGEEGVVVDVSRPSKDDRPVHVFERERQQLLNAPAG